MNEELLKKRNKELSDEVIELSDEIIELRELLRKGYTLCPECKRQDGLRIWCNLCDGKGYVHYSKIMILGENIKVVKCGCGREWKLILSTPPNFHTPKPGMRLMLFIGKGMES